MMCSPLWQRFRCLYIELSYMISIGNTHRFCGVELIWSVPWQNQGTKITGKASLQGRHQDSWETDNSRINQLINLGD